jgi:hypothetical protein
MAEEGLALFEGLTGARPQPATVASASMGMSKVLMAFTRSLYHIAQELATLEACAWRGIAFRM